MLGRMPKSRVVYLTTADVITLYEEHKTLASYYDQVLDLVQAYEELEYNFPSPFAEDYYDFDCYGVLVSFEKLHTFKFGV